MIAIHSVRCTECIIYYRKYIPQISQPSQYRCTQLQYTFAVISEAPSIRMIMYMLDYLINVHYAPFCEMAVGEKFPLAGQTLP